MLEIWEMTGFESREQWLAWVKEQNEENRRRRLSGEPTRHEKGAILARKHTKCGDCGSWNVYVNIPPCCAISQCQDCRSHNMAWDEKGKEE